MFKSKAETAQPVTIVMPVYNALPYLNEAVASVLTQTYQNFQLAIYDDHSTDGSYEAALTWAQRDSRVTVARGSHRLGPCGSSNAAVALARTEIVARMDADDVMAAERIEFQLAVLERYPQAVLVGSAFDMIDGRGKRFLNSNAGHVTGKSPPIAHSSICYRRAAFNAVGAYREDTDYFEDYDLYQRIYRLGEVAVVNQPLMKVRFSGFNRRLRDDLPTVLAKINRLYAQDGDERSDVRFLSPMAFYSIANLAMMSGSRPHMLGLMLRKISFRDPALAVLVLGFSILAEFSPRLAHMAWHVATNLRSRLLPKPEADRDVFLWSPNSHFGLKEYQQAASTIEAKAA